MAQDFRIALTWPADRHQLKEYQAHVSPHCKIAGPKGSAMEDLIEVAAEADAIMGAYIPQEMIEKAPKLKMVQILHAGVATAYPGDTVLGFRLDYLASRGILMGNIHGNALSVAEHAMCFILAMAKQLIPVNQAVSGNEWYPVTEENKSYMLCDSTLGIVGLGHIGGDQCRPGNQLAKMRICSVSGYQFTAAGAFQYGIYNQPSGKQM